MEQFFLLWQWSCLYGFDCDNVRFKTNAGRAKTVRINFRQQRAVEACRSKDAYDSLTPNQTRLATSYFNCIHMCKIVDLTNNNKINIKKRIIITNTDLCLHCVHWWVGDLYFDILFYIWFSWTDAFIQSDIQILHVKWSCRAHVQVVEVLTIASKWFDTNMLLQQEAWSAVLLWVNKCYTVEELKWLS